MPCFSPLRGFLPPTPDANGKRYVSFKPKLGYEETAFPCGACMGCRVAYSNAWAVRMMHEASLHPHSWFVTLTYEKNPPHGSLQPRDMTLFLKRWRKALNEPLRFYQVGEYGELSWRPHHHMAAYGPPLNDLKLYKKSGAGPLYISPSLEKHWGHGYVTVAPLTIESAAYMARYVTKRKTGDQADEHYRRVDPETGEIVYLQPEFATMSRRPGLGQGWLDKYAGDIYPSDFVVYGGRIRGAPPPFYDRKIKAHAPELIEAMKAKRKARAQEPKHQANSTKARLKVRSDVLEAKLSLRKRNVS